MQRAQPTISVKKIVVVNHRDIYFSSRGWAEILPRTGEFSDIVLFQLKNNTHVSNHRHLLCRLFRRTSKKTSKLRVTGLCEGNLPVIGGFPSQRASYAENVSIWWRFMPCQSLQISVIPFVLVGTVTSSVGGIESFTRQLALRSNER